MTPAADERRDADKPGYRFGPFVLVPELRTSADDPWAHRKGEPRILALLWAMYLMGGALTTIFSVRSLGAPSADRYAYGCRAMIFIVVVGVSVLWPMTRLSQARPRLPARATLIDLFAILAPVQAVVWPMSLLTAWGWDVVAGLNLMIASWAALAGVLVMRGSASPSIAVRTLLTLVLIGLVGAAPGLSLILASAGAPPLPGWWGMLSPITATLELTAAPGNRLVTMSVPEWVGAAAPLAVGAALFPLLRPPARSRIPAPPEARSAPADADRWSGSPEA